MKKAISLVFCIVIATLCFAGCGKNSDSKTITVAASSTPHAEILEQCKKDMQDKGYTLKIKVMTDYVTPNTATEDGDVDANFFQHTPYLDQFNKENKTHLVSVLKVHFEPLGIYAGTAKKLEEIPKGAKIAVPNDVTNEARALLLLDANGLIKLKDNKSLTATKNDITENKNNYEIIEADAENLPNLLDEVAVAVINGNYAVGAGLKVSGAITAEKADSAAAQTYGNILVVREGNEENEAVKALVEVLKSKNIADYITKTYDGAVVALN